MISLSWRSDFEPNQYDSDAAIAALVQKFKQLPRHIAKKHMKAALRRTMLPAIPILRRNTPPLDTRRGRRRAGLRRRSTGALRRAVTTRTGQTGRNSDFNSFVWAVLGYKAGPQSRKAIWLEYGTNGGNRAFKMMEKTLSEYGPVSAAKLANELASAFEKAVAELGSGKNPGMSKRGLAAGIAPRG